MKSANNIPWVPSPTYDDQVSQKQLIASVEHAKIVLFLHASHTPFGNTATSIQLEDHLLHTAFFNSTAFLVYFSMQFLLTSPVTVSPTKIVSVTLLVFVHSIIPSLFNINKTWTQQWYIFEINL